MYECQTWQIARIVPISPRSTLYYNNDRCWCNSLIAVFPRSVRSYHTIYLPVILFLPSNVCLPHPQPCSYNWPDRYSSSALQEGKNEWFMHLPKVNYLCIYQKAKFIWIDLLKGGSLYLQLRQQADQQAGGELRQPSSRFGRCITGRCFKYSFSMSLHWME